MRAALIAPSVALSESFAEKVAVLQSGNGKTLIVVRIKQYPDEEGHWFGDIERDLATDAVKFTSTLENSLSAHGLSAADIDVFRLQISTDLNEVK